MPEKYANLGIYLKSDTKLKIRLLLVIRDNQQIKKTRNQSRSRSRIWCNPFTADAQKTKNKLKTVVYSRRES